MSLAPVSLSPDATKTPEKAPPAGKHAAMERARRVLAENRAWHFSSDDVVDLAGRMLLEDAGVKVGAIATVLQGRHKGLTGPIETVNWSEAEIRIEGHARWFGLWHDRSYFRVAVSPPTEP